MTVRVCAFLYRHGVSEAVAGHGGRTIAGGGKGMILAGGVHVSVV